MRQKVPQVFRSVVWDYLKTILTGVVVWLLCALFLASLALRAMRPVISEVAASTIVGLPLGIQIP